MEELKPTAAEHPFLTEWRLKKLSYIVIPKALIQSAEMLGITAEDALLYCVLRSRCDYSFKNKWIDDEGRIYIIFTREQAAAYMGWSKGKTLQAFGRLLDAGLIHEVSQKHKNRTVHRIYVHRWDAPVELDGIRGYSVAEIRTGALPYLCAQNISDKGGSYFILPRLLMEHEMYRDLPLRAKLLYVFLLEEMHMSILYAERIDENGLPYCYLDSDEAIAQLQCKGRTLTTLIGNLEDIGLMVRVQKGYSQDRRRVYLRDFVPSNPSDSQDLNLEEPNDFAESQKMDRGVAKNEPRSRKYCTTESQDLNPRIAKNVPAEPQKMSVSEPSLVKNESKLFSGVSIAARAADASGLKKQILGSLRSQLDYVRLLDDLSIYYGFDSKEKTKLIVDTCIDLMTADMTSQSEYIRFGDKVFPREELVEAYDRINRHIMQTMVMKVMDHYDEIKNLNSYLHQTLVTAVEQHEGESYYVERETAARRSNDCNAWMNDYL